MWRSIRLCPGFWGAEQCWQEVVAHTVQWGRGPVPAVPAGMGCGGLVPVAVGMQAALEDGGDVEGELPSVRELRFSSSLCSEMCCVHCWNGARLRERRLWDLGPQLACAGDVGALQLGGSSRTGSTLLAEWSG